VTIEVTPEKPALQEEASRRRLSAEQLASELLNDGLQDLAQDAEDAVNVRRILAASVPGKWRPLDDLHKALCKETGTNEQRLSRQHLPSAGSSTRDSHCQSWALRRRVSDE
jgi:hypothetical protein